MTNVKIMDGDRPGSPLEAHVVSENGVSREMYRLKNGRWQERSGYGAPWHRCDRPSLPAGIIIRLEEEA